MTAVRDATPMELAGRMRAATDRLTRREAQTLRMAANGMSNKQIAGKMGIGHQTVKNHLIQAYRKLERAGLPSGDDYPRAHYAYLLGLLDGVRWATYGTGDVAIRAEMV